MTSSLVLVTLSLSLSCPVCLSCVEPGTQGQAPEKGGQNCASFLDPLVPGIMVPVHGN